MIKGTAMVLKDGVFHFTNWAIRFVHQLEPGKVINFELDVFPIYTYLCDKYILLFIFVKVFLVRKITGKDAGTLFAMKVLKKATLKGMSAMFKDIFF